MNSTDTFDLYSQYYDLLYQDKATEEECLYLIDLLKKYDAPGKDWIEFGSGSGRHGKVLAQHGIRWSGLERSQKMAEEGRKKGLSIHIVDISKPIIGSPDKDAVLALFHVISYLTRNEEVLTAFKNAYALLKPGGIFVFDIWYSPAVLTQLPEERTKRVESKMIKVVRKATPTIYWNENTVNVHYDIAVTNLQTNETQTFAEDHLMRHFSLPELQQLAHFAGFEFLHTEEWMTKVPASNNTWGICCLLKKNVNEQ